MKRVKQYAFYLLIIVFSGILLNSCSKKDTPVGPNYQYFISSENKLNITTQQAKTNLLTFQVIIPPVHGPDYFSYTPQNFLTSLRDFP